MVCVVFSVENVFCQDSVKKFSNVKPKTENFTLWIGECMCLVRICAISKSFMWVTEFQLESHVCIIMLQCENEFKF